LARLKNSYVRAFLVLMSLLSIALASGAADTFP
jgi:hypothetical protein